MLTVGMSLMIKGAARVPFGGDIYSFPPMFASGPVNVFGVAVAPQSILIVGACAVLAILLHLLFKYTSLGKQMRATASNLAGARVIGVNIGRIHGITWALACGLGAAAGVLAGPITMLHPEMGSMGLLKGFAAAVLGGMGSMPGAILGGLLMGVIEMTFGFYVSTQFMNVSPFLVIIFVLLVFPRGLLGEKEAKRV
jgi:branched-chain amino acid transport system permease protein